MLFLWRVWVGCFAIAIAGASDAAVVSFSLDQSNELADGPAYLRVTIDDEGLSGRINFHVAALSPLFSLAEENFGIQKFGFNSAFSLSAAKIVGLPANWSYDGAGAMSAFGRYGAITEANKGSARLRALSFSITGLSSDTISSYLLPSSGHAGEGNFFFAAHVAGFESPECCHVTSAYFAGSKPEPVAAVPLPGSAWLLLGGLIALGNLFRAFRVPGLRVSIRPT